MDPCKVSLKLPASARHQVFFSETGIRIIESFAGIEKSAENTKYLSDCKLLLHELFTNAVNHSGSSEVEFQFSFEENLFSIEMVFEGAGFTIKPVKEDSTPGTVKHKPPYKGLEGEKFILHLDADFEVVCEVTGEHELTLKNRERTSPKAEDRFSIPEHFGLFIITMLGHDVHYKRDKEGKNFFSLKKSLP